MRKLSEVAVERLEVNKNEVIKATIKSQGFTLIEVLIGLTLLSIMVVLLFTSLKICADSWERGEIKITSVNEMGVVYNFFQQHLSVARPAWNDVIGEEKMFSFQSNSQTLHFVSEFPASVGRMGLQLFSVTLNEEGDESFLKVTLEPFGKLAEGEDRSQEEVILIKHVKDFKISYFGAEDQASEGVWEEEWLGRSVLPRLVKIKIDLISGIYWPEMTFDLKVTGPSDELMGITASGAGL